LSVHIQETVDVSWLVGARVARYAYVGAQDFSSKYVTGARSGDHRSHEAEITIE